MMNLVLNVLILFVFFGPLYVGITTIWAFLPIKKNSHLERINECRSRKILAVCIALVVLIPLEFLYSVLTKGVPDGTYELDVNYSLSVVSEEYDAGSDSYNEVVVKKTGVGKLFISVINDVDYINRGHENFYGIEKTETHYYQNFYTQSILLDCFGGEKIDIYDEEIEENSREEFEFERDGKLYFLVIDIGALTDKDLGYTLEDRINNISIGTIVEHCILMFFSVIGIIGFFVSDYLYRKQNSEKNFNA